MRAFGLALVGLALLVTPALAAPLHDAMVGQEISVLTEGLEPVPSQVVNGCGEQFLLMGFRGPNQTQEGGYSEQALIAKDGSIRALVTFDEDDLSLPVMLYVGDAKGIIRYKAPVESADKSRICRP